MKLENTMKLTQWNLTNFYKKPYQDEYLEHWADFYTDHEFLRLIRFERFLTNPIFWVKCLGRE